MDDDASVVGDATVLNVNDNTSVADMKKAVQSWVAKNAKPAADEG